MRDYGIDKGLIEFRDDASRSQRGWSKGFWGFRKMFRDYLTKLHVAFYDECCPAASPEGIFPVRFNQTTGSAEYFNGTAWVEFAGGGGAAATALTAFAGGGQGSATALTVGFNEVTTVATAGDSVKLPGATPSATVIVKNEGATAADVFPATGDTINDGAANAAIRIAPGSTIVFTAINTTNWEASNQVLSGADGAVGAPSLSFSTQPDMGLYKVSSTQLGVAVSGALVGGFNATGAFTDVISEQTTAAGVTIDSVKLKDGGVSNAGDTMIAGFYPIAAQQALSGAGAVNVTSYFTAFTSTGAGNALTLANGTQIGQMKEIAHVVDGGSGVLTPTSLTGGTTITFTTVGEVAILLWNGTTWRVQKLYNSATPGTPPVLA